MSFKDNALKIAKNAKSLVFWVPVLVISSQIVAHYYYGFGEHNTITTTSGSGTTNVRITTDDHMPTTPMAKPEVIVGSDYPAQIAGGDFVVDSKDWGPKLPTNCPVADTDEWTYTFTWDFYTDFNGWVKVDGVREYMYPEQKGFYGVVRYYQFRLGKSQGPVKGWYKWVRIPTKNKKDPTKLFLTGT